MVQQHLVWEYN